MNLHELLRRFVTESPVSAHLIHKASDIVPLRHLDREVVDYRPKDWLELREYLAAGKWPGAKRGWGRFNIKEFGTQLRRALQWGYATELLPTDMSPDVVCCWATPFRYRDPKQLRVVAWSEVVALRDHLDDWHWDSVQLLWHTGMRGKELFDMRPCDIEKREDVWLYRPPNHKTSWRGKEKIIGLGPQSIAIVSRNIAALPSLMPAIPGKLVSLQNRLDKVQRRLYGKTTWSLHCLRHTRATIVRGKMGLEASAAMLGNSISAAQIYAERNQQLVIRCAQLEEATE